MSIYLDNAATSYPKPETVYQAVMRAMREIGASPGRGGYWRSLEASRMLFRTREVISALFSIPESSQIIFTHSATEALNLALRGTLLPGDHVITTVMEHNSLLRPLHALRKMGVELTIVSACGTGIVDPDDIRAAIRPNTRMVALSHVSNVCGAIQPIERISSVAREANALFLVDAAQSAGSIPIDVTCIGIDLLAVPGHKDLLGPQGTGFLYVAEGKTLRPLLAGGTGSNASAMEQPDNFPEGFEAGTHNLPGIAGLCAGVEFVLKQGVECIGRKERDCTAIIASVLGNIPKVILYGPSCMDERSGPLSFSIAGMDSSGLAFALDRDFDISVRAGLHCAPQAHRALGTYPAGTIRVSPGWFTTDDEIAIFCDAIITLMRYVE